MIIDLISSYNYIHFMPVDFNKIEDIFSENGLLAQSLPEFEFRSSQLRMARLIERAINKNTQVIIEAGTGVGKTMGYLIPILMSGKKTVISTGTKNLQEQIFLKDIPLIAKAMGINVSSLLMKGRKNYICLYRYNQHFSASSFLEPLKEKLRLKIDRWLERTESGDRAELKWLRDDDPLWDAVSSSSHQCKGPDCIHRQDCFINRLHRLAARSDIIIVNHHLFFADLMIKKGGFGEIIPRFQMVVFDEAHKIEEIATTYFGERLSTGQLLDLVQDAEKEKKDDNNRDNKEVENNLNFIRSGVELFERIFVEADVKGRLDVMSSFHKYQEPISYIRKGLAFLQKASDYSLAGRANELEDSLNIIFSPENAKGLDWYEKRKRGITFHISPLDISGNMIEFLYAKVKNIVFTSATISANGTFDYIRSRLGIPEEALEGIYPSHFDLKNQTLMYIPRDLPSPNSSDFGSRIGDRIISILKMTSGRALILFTSYINLNIAYEKIKEAIPYRVYKQGDAPRTMILERFRNDTHSVLMATGSFWQGVDVPGETLSCLIIDKLPFDSPGEPLVAARIDAIKDKGGNPFMEYQLPNAIISLKQGLGRLIRKSSDRGILAILDSRIIKSRYGRFFIQSLPEIQVSHELEDIGNFLERRKFN